MDRDSVILIVDDNPQGLQALEDVLFGQGYTLICASNGPEALREAAEFPPDLILLDVMMPGMDGFEVCRRLRADAHLAAVPVVMVTALDDQASRIKGLEAGADDFITKPYNRAELRARVKTITRLNRYRRLQEETAKRKDAEESKVRLATAVEQGAESIIITDTRGTILYVNPAFEKKSGYSSAEVLGKNPRLLKSGKQDDALFRCLWETLGRGETWRGHFTNKHKDGSIYEEDATISPVRDDTGKIANYVAVNRDVTREMQLEAQFRQSQKMEAFGLLAGGVAHDFNNILNVVIGYSEIWLMKLPDETPVCNALKMIRSAGERAVSLTRQLLAFSRQSVLETKVVELNGVIADTVNMLKRLIGEDIELSQKLDPTLPRIKVDPGQIGQVLMNLAVNARDAMPRGGTLTILTGSANLDDAYILTHAGARPGPHVMLSVSDTGTGMPAETVARIFEPFFTTKEVGKGTGLGLAVVHGVVTQSGGSIEVESQVGFGTTFRLYFPATTELLQPAINREAMASFEGNETILVVEDEDVFRGMTAEALRIHGYNVLTARSGSEAIAIVGDGKTKIDLVLTDVVMRGISGRDLAEALQRQSPAQKIVFMSGYTADAMLRYGLEHDKVAFLQKPFSHFDLLNKVREAMSNA